MIELRQLRSFLALADHLHFGRAAERLGIAQPGLTQQIQRMESELGVALFDRTQRRVQLTAAGRVLVDEGRRVVAQAERAQSLTQRAGRGEVGRLVLGVAESASYAILPELLREYRRAYPDVDLAVRMMTTSAQIAALRAGDIDAGLARTPISADDLEVRTIRVDAVAVLVPDQHRLVRCRSVALRELAGEALVVYPTGPRSSWTAFMLSVLRTAGVEPGQTHEASDAFAAVAFVAAGLGVTLVPGGRELFTRPGVVWRPVSRPAPLTRLVLLHGKERTTPTVAALVGVVKRLWPRQRERIRRASG